MKRHHRRTALHRRKRQRPRLFPYIRVATIVAADPRAPAVPCLRLQGDWLTEAGFFPYWRVKITVTGGKLVIEPLLDALEALRESAPLHRKPTDPDSPRTPPTPAGMSSA